MAATPTLAVERTRRAPRYQSARWQLLCTRPLSWTCICYVQRGLSGGANTVLNGGANANAEANGDKV